MTIYTPGPRPGEAIKSWPNGQRGQEDAVVASAVRANEVVGKVTRGAASVVAAPKAGNVGNGVLTVANPGLSAGTDPGVFTVMIIEPATNGGAFDVEGPDGVNVGHGTIGVAFDGPVKFTLADGSTDFAAGDTFDVTVSYAAGSNAIKPWSPTATDGSEDVFGVALFGRAAGEPATVFTDDCEFKAAKLITPTGANPTETAALREQAFAGLRARRNKVR